MQNQSVLSESPERGLFQIFILGFECDKEKNTQGPCMLSYRTLLFIMTFNHISKWKAKKDTKKTPSFIGGYL